MDAVQIVNGCAALIGVAAAQYAFTRVTLHNPGSIFAHLGQVTLLIWYAAVNLALGLGLWTATLDEIVPLFRFAFAPLLGTIAARQFLAARRSVQV